MVFREKNQKGEGVRRLGEQTLPNHFNQAAETRPHLVGGILCFSDMALSPAGFPVAAPEFDEMAFDFLL